ncbi:MAG: hypothetical protein Q7U47_14240 [Paludibacter sp.]|nr:hypothetical protein [Paludibacter sp.]
MLPLPIAIGTATAHKLGRWVESIEKKTMKPFSYILLVTLFANPVFAQKYKLISTRHFYDDSKDCSKIGNCISSKQIQNDTLHLTIFIDNNGRDLDAYRNSFTFRNDTLNLNLNDTNKVVKTKVFNKSKNKMEAFLTRTVPAQMLIYGGTDIQRIQYTFIGFDKVPRSIRFCNTSLCDCPTKPIKFEICDNDTINMINENGYKHGNWIEFYDTGEIMKKKKYSNGMLVEGYLYDKHGKATHTLKKEAMETGTPLEQTK